MSPGHQGVIWHMDWSYSCIKGQPRQSSTSPDLNVRVLVDFSIRGRRRTSTTRWRCVQIEWSWQKLLFQCRNHWLQNMLIFQLDLFGISNHLLWHTQVRKVFHCLYVKFIWIQNWCLISWWTRQKMMAMSVLNPKPHFWVEAVPVPKVNIAAASDLVQLKNEKL